MLDGLIQSRLLRLVAGLVLLGVSTGLWVAGWFWPWGWVLGGILLLWAIPSGGSREQQF